MFTNPKVKIGDKLRIIEMKGEERYREKKEL